MAAPENEGLYFLSYLLIHMWYFNDSGVYCDVFGVKESEYGVEMAIIVVAGWYFWYGEVKLTENSIFGYISCYQTTFINIPVIYKE